MTLPSDEFVAFVDRLNASDAQAREELAPLVIDELRRIASRFIREDEEVAGIEQDMLVDDAFMELTRPKFHWRNAREFYWAAARFMSRRLVDGHRRSARLSRGGGRSQIQIDLDELPSKEAPVQDFLALDEVMDAMRKLEPRLAEVVDVHLILGEGFDTTAKALDLDPRTVRRRWQKAKEHLRESLSITHAAAVSAEVRTQTISIQLTVNQDFDAFTSTELSSFKSGLEELLGGHVRVLAIQRGSTKITIDVTREQAEQLLWLHERGVLADLNISNAQILGNAVAAAVIQSKAQAREFDVFLCHNSEDKVEVKRIGIKLRQRGLLPWLDEWELQPGVPWQDALEREIGTINSAAVFVGESGIGPWQTMEINGFIREFVNRRCPVIPVILRHCTTTPQLPTFLNGMMWVDFRKRRPSPYDQLVWGITGRKPNDG